MEEERQSGDDKDWHTVFEEEDPRPFWVRDETGECLVVPAWADMRMNTVTETMHPDSWFSDPPEPLQHVDTGLFTRNVRFSEERLEPGWGYVIGRFTTSEGDADGEHIEHLTGVLASWKTGYMGEVDGRPDKHRPNAKPGDWEHGTTAHAIARWVREHLGRDEPVHVLGATDESRRPFIVGMGGEGKIVNRLRWTWIGASVAFVVIGTLLAALLLARMGVLG